MQLRRLLRVSATVALAAGALLFMQVGGAAQKAAAGAAEGVKGGSDETGPYDVAPNWPQPLHSDWTWGRTGGVWAESPDRVFILQTGEIPVATRGAQGNPPKRHAVDHPDTRKTEHQMFIVDRNGKLVESWEQHHDLWVHPHSIKQSPYDPDKFVWALDGRSESGKCAEQVFKFTHDGKLVMTLGEHGVPGNDKSHFAGPTDLAFFPNGDFLVADGYKNGRIVRFDKTGKYLMEFGTRGRAPGQFTQVHGVAIDAKGRILTADRGNHRIQIFDQSGKLLDLWPNIEFPDDMAVTNDGFVWVADGEVQKMLKFDMNGKLLYSWGTYGTSPGRLWGTHRFSVDQEGNLYTAEVYGGRAQKFVPKKGADPTRLIGMFYGFKK